MFWVTGKKNAAVVLQQRLIKMTTNLFYLIALSIEVF